MDNPIFALMRKLPTNGWVTAFGGLLSVMFGVSGLLTQKLDPQTAFGFMIGGLTALGLGNKLEGVKTLLVETGQLPPPPVQ